MKKNVFWVHDGKKYIGYAELDEYVLALRAANGDAIELLEAEEIENGATLEEIFDDIPEDVTDFNLK